MAKVKTEASAKGTSKRKAKKRSAKVAAQDGAAVVPEDPMTQCVALCQELRWREALLLARKMQARAAKDGRTDLPEALHSAFVKIEYSLRRQMGAALGAAVKHLLKKEYLLDVGE